MFLEPIGTKNAAFMMSRTRRTRKQGEKNDWIPENGQEKSIPAAVEPVFLPLRCGLFPSRRGN
jgi:hypothetical protein